MIRITHQSTFCFFRGSRCKPEGTVDDIRRVVDFLASNGYKVTGITFDFFQADGLRGTGLLPDGRTIRFWIPDAPEALPVIGAPRSLLSGGDVLHAPRRRSRC